MGTNLLPGPSVDDFATALKTLDTWQVTPPAPVTVGSYTGKHVTLTVQGPGQVEDMRVLDIGGTRYLVFTTSSTCCPTVRPTPISLSAASRSSHLPGAPADKRTQLDQMVDSMEIAPITP